MLHLCFKCVRSAVAPGCLATLLLLGLGIPVVGFSDTIAPIMGDLDHITSPLPAEYRVHRDGSATLRVCYNWACAVQAEVTFTPRDLAEVRMEMGRCTGQTLYERLQRVRIGIWQMELMAQKYIPELANDLAINDQDQDLDGRTDCIDNSSNTTTFLRVLRDLQDLPGWRIAEAVVRDRLTEDVHWTAVITDEGTGEDWAVDSWYRPHGHLPFVQPLGAWGAGDKAWEPPFEVLNPFPRRVDELCLPDAVQRASLPDGRG